MSAHVGPRTEMSGITLFLDSNSRSYPGSGSKWYNLVDTIPHVSMTDNVLFISGGLYFPGSSSWADSTGTISASTVVTFVRPAITGAAGFGLCIYGPTSNGSDNMLAHTNGLFYTFFTEFADTNNSSSFANAPVIITGTVYHVATTISGSTTEIFVNGELKNSLVVPWTIGSWTSIPVIGARGNRTQFFFSGTIYSVKVYDRKLSVDEIAQSYQSFRSIHGI